MKDFITTTEAGYLRIGNSLLCTMRIPNLHGAGTNQNTVLENADERALLPFTAELVGLFAGTRIHILDGDTVRENETVATLRGEYELYRADGHPYGCFYLARV